MTESTVHLTAQGPFAHLIATRGGKASTGPDDMPPVTASSPPDHAKDNPLPGGDEPISYQRDIKPLFREGDRRSMSFAFDLWSYDDVSSRAAGILQRLGDGSMPCDGPWPPAQIEVFRQWTETGMRR